MFLVFSLTPQNFIVLWRDTYSVEIISDMFNVLCFHITDCVFACVSHDFLYFLSLFFTLSYNYSIKT